MIWSAEPDDPNSDNDAATQHPLIPPKLQPAVGQPTKVQLASEMTMPPRRPKSLAIARKSLLAVAATEERRLRGVIEAESASAEDKEQAASQLSALFQQTVLRLASLEQVTEREAEVA